MTNRGTLRVACVGAGYFSQFHLEAWSRMTDVELCALCELDPAKAKQAADRYQIPRVYDNVESMLDEQQPDCVDIITRPDSHLALVQLAAKRGIDVICQKPVAPTFEEASALVQTAKDANIRCMIHENFRFQPWHREIKRLIEQGVIGDQLHSISCQTRMGDGWQQDAYQARQPYFVDMPQFLIFETGVHFIDVYRYLFGEIDGVFASLQRLNPRIAGEDSGMILFEFASGARGIWDANRFNEPNCATPRYTFGRFLIEGNGGSIRLADDGQMTIQSLGQAEVVHPYPHGQQQFASDCVFTTQLHFVDALRNRTAFETDGVEYLKTLRVQQAIYQSATTGQPVRQIMTGAI